MNVVVSVLFQIAFSVVAGVGGGVLRENCHEAREETLPQVVSLGRVSVAHEDIQYTTAYL
jgi:hypothetical protein